MGLLPLLGGCAAAYLVSSFLMRDSIMTGKIARRARLPAEYTADLFPVLDEHGTLVGVVTRRDLFNGKVAGERPVRDVIKRAPIVAFEDNSLREAADHMVVEDRGRLPIVDRSQPRHVIGFPTRSDLLAAHHPRLGAAPHAERVPARRTEATA